MITKGLVVRFEFMDWEDNPEQVEDLVDRIKSRLGHFFDGRISVDLEGQSPDGSEYTQIHEKYRMGFRRRR